MKSTASKKRGSILTKKYIGLFVFLFALVLLLFFEHFNESPIGVRQVQVGETYEEEKAEAGYKAPRFTLKNLQGHPHSLEDYKGQVVILNFWATWCAPCRVEMPSFETLYRRYRDDGLVILAVSIDKIRLEGVREFADQYQLSFPILLDTGGEVEKLYPSFTIPATFIIDKSGHVVTQVDGAKNWKSQQTFDAVEYLLNRP